MGLNALLRLRVKPIVSRLVLPIVLLVHVVVSHTVRHTVRSLSPLLGKAVVSGELSEGSQVAARVDLMLEKVLVVLGSVHGLHCAASCMSVVVMRTDLVV